MTFPARNRFIVDPANAVDWQHPLNRGRIAWWYALPGVRAGGRVVDLCQVASAGPMVLGPGSTARSPLWRTAKSGAVTKTGVDLDGNTSNRIFGEARPGPYPASVTIAFWIFNRATTGTRYFVTCKTNATSGIAIWQSGTNLNFSTSTNGTTYSTTSATGVLATQSWQRVVATWDATVGTRALFLDAVSVGSGSGTAAAINYAGGVWRFGSEPQFLGMVDGIISDIAVWSRPLSAREVIADYRHSVADYQTSHSPIRWISTRAYFPASIYSAQIAGVAAEPTSSIAAASTAPAQPIQTVASLTVPVSSAAIVAAPPSQSVLIEATTATPSTTMTSLAAAPPLVLSASVAATAPGCSAVAVAARPSQPIQIAAVADVTIGALVASTSAPSMAIAGAAMVAFPSSSGFLLATSVEQAIAISGDLPPATASVAITTTMPATGIVAAGVVGIPASSAVIVAGSPSQGLAASGITVTTKSGLVASQVPPDLGVIGGGLIDPPDVSARLTSGIPSLQMGIDGVAQPSGGFAEFVGVMPAYPLIAAGLLPEALGSFVGVAEMEEVTPAEGWTHTDLGRIVIAHFRGREVQPAINGQVVHSGRNRVVAAIDRDKIVTGRSE